MPYLYCPCVGNNLVASAHVGVAKMNVIDRHIRRIDHLNQSKLTVIQELDDFLEELELLGKRDPKAELEEQRKRREAQELIELAQREEDAKKQKEQEERLKFEQRLISNGFVTVCPCCENVFLKLPPHPEEQYKCARCGVWLVGEDSRDVFIRNDRINGNPRMYSTIASAPGAEKEKE